MHNKIISEFRNSVNFAKSDEVQLFRTLAKAIVKHSQSTFIDETHGGNVCNVSFVSATGKTETCEIADLLIVSAEGNGTQQLRATFWQAKKQSVSKWLNVTSTGSQLDFKGQFNQWDLLSRRPDINGVGAFVPPTNLLGSFSSSGIGTFGVFHEKGGLLEVAHSIAEFISCPTPAAKHPTLSINGYMDKYSYPFGEVITRSNLLTFIQSLFAFQIGALLEPSNASHCWLVNRVRNKVAAVADPMALQALNGFFGHDMQRSDDATASFEGLSILLIGALNEA